MMEFLKGLRWKADTDSRLSCQEQELKLEITNSVKGETEHNDNTEK
jgi:hypothetical protein